MKIAYCIKGEHRKHLVQAIAEELNTKATYCGAPSFAYSVGDLTISADGTVTGADDRSLIVRLREAHGLSPATEEYERGATEKPDGLVVSVARAGVSDEAIENLKRLVASKATLIRKAVAADNVDIEVEENALHFPWWDTMPRFENITTYSFLISKLVEAAKTQKRVNAREEAKVENEKYAFRCFLLRLGFIGDEFKPMRKVLLEGLDGNSAFKAGAAKS